MLDLKKQYEAERPDRNEKIVCRKCGRRLLAKNSFFAMPHYSDGSRYPVCKECLTAFIDNTKRDTFEWILRDLDIPYVKEQWVKIYNDKMLQNNKVKRDDVLGRYVRYMKLGQNKNYYYEDTAKIEESYNKRQEQIKANLAMYDEETQEILLDLQNKLDQGLITQEQYDSQSPLTKVGDVAHQFLEFKKAIGEDEEEIRKQLSDDEVRQMQLKWGESYKPSQWVKMEKTWNQYLDEYEMDVDRELVLKQICKLNLKMDEALDMGDFKSYRDLSNTFDTLRKSASFTKVQNKDGEGHYLDAVGELVAFVEKEGGIIEQIPWPDDYPQDAVDYAIKNMKSYTYDLVTNELGLGNMIESYIKKLEEQANSEVDYDEGIITSEKEQQKTVEELEAQEAEEFEKYLEDDIEAEIAAIAEGKDD